MRLWHYKIIPYLPDGQLLAQKRECDLMFRDYLNDKKTNHILINYVWKYPIDDLISYYSMLEEEFFWRNFKFNKETLNKVKEKARDYRIVKIPFETHHNKRYLKQCFYNLQEKYDRGQKDFNIEKMWKLLDFVKAETKEN